MSDSRDRMVDDMGRKVGERIQELMQREIDLARHVFTPTEITTLVMKIAVGVNMAAIGVAMQTRRDDVEPADLFDLVAAAMAEMVKANKPGLDNILKVIELARGGRR